MPSSSSGGSNESQTSTGTIDKYIYEISESERIQVCHYLEQPKVWEDLANRMGYTDSDRIVSFVFFLFSTLIHILKKFQNSHLITNYMRDSYHSISNFFNYLIEF